MNYAKVKSLKDNGALVVLPHGWPEDTPDDMLPIALPYAKESMSMPRVGDTVALWNAIGIGDLRWRTFHHRKSDSELDVLIKNFATKGLDVILCREDGCKPVIYASDDTGITIKTANSEEITDVSGWHTAKYGNGTAHREIGINANGVHLGTADKAAEPVVLGDKMMDTMKELVSLLEDVKQNALTNPYTIMIGKAIEAKLPNVKEKLEKILSKEVYTD